MNSILPFAVTAALLLASGCCTSGTDPAPLCVPNGGASADGFVMNTRVTACGSGPLTCRVDVDGQRIAVTIESTSCLSVVPVAHGCSEQLIPCQIPPLAPGRYVLAGREQNELDIVAAGGVASCTVPERALGP